MQRWLSYIAYLGKFMAFGLAAALLALVVLQRGASPNPGATAIAPRDLGNLHVSYAQAVDRAAPAVVNIYADRTVREQPVALLRDPQLQQFTGSVIIGRPRWATKSELGSGVIVSKDGYILTNNHVIAAADNIHIALWDGRVTDAQVVGTDSETDLAVLKIDLDELPTLPFAQSTQLHIGDVVLAIGNPLGLGKTVTMGIVSATGRTDLNISTYENFIQTDAAINQGNSGGALVNSTGALVGITTATLGGDNSKEGFGFAIPIDMARSVMDQIVANGRVIRGWLGVEMEDGATAAANCKQPAAYVVAIYANGPAHLAGILPGDCITRFDDTAVRELRPLYDAIADTAPGTEVRVELDRHGAPLTMQATLISRPSGPRIPLNNS